MDQKAMIKKVVMAVSLFFCLSGICTLAACGNNKLNGSYKSQGLVSQTFTFDGDEVTMSAFGLNASGTYEIKNDKIYITYTLFGKEQTWSQSFFRTDDGFTISDTEFKKN